MLAAALAALGASCGLDSPGEVAAAQGRRVQVLNLEAADAGIAAQPIERYRLLRPSPDAPWEVFLAESELVEVEGDDERAPAHALVLDSDGPSRVVIEGPFDGRAFNAVAVEVEYGARRDFALEFISRGVVSPVQGQAHCEKREGRQTLLFTLPSLFTPLEEIGRLRLRCLTQVEDLRIHSVDLLRKPIGLRLPTPEGGADLLLVNEEGRRGVGIDARHGVRSRCSVEEDALLRFSYAAPSSEEPPDRAAGLRVTLTGSEGLSESHEFHPTGPAEFSWHDVRLSLAGFAGQELQILWEITAPTPAPWALAEAGVLQGEGPPARVILITSDTHRADHLSLGRAGSHARTPTLDGLAERGILFEDCFTATNVTNPSHIALMTATHPRDTGILGNNEPMSGAADTLAEAFRAAGFATFASVSVQHLDHPMSGLGQGFDRYSSPRLEGLRDAQETIDTLLSWVESNRDVPLFLWLHLFDAHVPYTPPEDVLASYYPSPEVAFDPDAPAPEGVPSHVYEFIFPGLKDLDFPRALYAGEVTYLDRELARLLDHPTLGGAVIAFTADHGESLGDHGIFYAHADLYPDSLHVPLILSYPGGPRGVRVEQPVRQIDLGRTLLDLAGLVGVEFPGDNLLRASEAGAGAPRFAVGAGPSTASITLNGWHLILALQEVEGHHRIEGRPLHEVTLHHLPSDPKALTDRVETDFERAQDLRRQLLDWLTRAQDRGWRAERITDAETLRSLEALGYTASAEGQPEELEFFDFGCRCEWCERFAEDDLR